MKQSLSFIYTFFCVFYSYFINGIMAMSGLSTGTGGNTNPTSSLEGAQKVLDLLNQK